MYYDFAESDRIRLEFIRNTELYTDEEKRVLAERSSDSLLRKLRHLHAMAKTKEQKQQFRDMAKNIAFIPEGCTLPLKARIIRKVIKMFYI